MGSVIYDKNGITAKRSFQDGEQLLLLRAEDSIPWEHAVELAKAILEAE